MLNKEKTMVDGINGAQGIKPKDLTIDWNDCTANEILEYKDEGQEIPTAILSWAEDMAKNQAGADEITYEMSLNNPDQMSVTSTANTNMGTLLREEMDANGVPIADQASTFATQSEEYSNSVTTLESDMETILSQSEEKAADIEEYSNNLLSQIQTLKTKQESMQNNISTQFAPIDALQIENQIRELATLGLSNIETDSQSVYSATNGINTAIDTATNASSIGTQAIDIGNELFNFNSITLNIIANHAISSGNNAINTAQAGKTTFNNTAQENTQNEDRVDNAKNTVSTTSGTFGITTAQEEETQNEDDIQQEAVDNATRDNQPVAEVAQEATDKFEQDRAADKEQAELDPTLADTSITTDPNEILKRKERRGLT